MIEVVRLTESSPRIAEEVSALATQLREEPSTISAEKLAALLKESNTIVMVARDEGRIVGMATLCITPRIGKRTALLEDVVVSEEYRGKGIGERIIRAIIDVAREYHVRRIQCTSRPSRVAAHKLYEKVGFKKYETNVFRLVLNPSD